MSHRLIGDSYEDRQRDQLERLESRVDKLEAQLEEVQSLVMALIHGMHGALSGSTLIGNAAGETVEAKIP